MKLLYPTSRELTDITQIIGPHTPGVVRATMVIGQDGSTTIRGTSSALSNPSDRQLYHALRDQADVIVVGSKSAHLYNKVTKPVVVLTRSQSLSTQIAQLRAAGHERILCEGGATLLSSLLAEDSIDELFLTVAPLEGDPDSPRIFGKDMWLEHVATESGYLFTHYVRNNRTDVGRGSR